MYSSGVPPCCSRIITDQLMLLIECTRLKLTPLLFLFFLYLLISKQPSNQADTNVFFFFISEVLLLLLICPPRGGHGPAGPSEDVFSFQLIEEVGILPPPLPGWSLG